MALRTKAREFAMQMLFQWEMSPQETRKLEIKFWRAATAAEDTEKFANELFEGAARRVKYLTRRLRSIAITGVSNVSPQSTARFCDWRFMNCRVPKRRTK